MSSSVLRRCVLAGVVVIAAATAAWVLIHASTRSEIARAKAVPSERPVVLEPVPAATQASSRARPNPASQLPGPPDPAAQKSSTAFAESAAQTAAELAAKSGSPSQ